MKHVDEPKSSQKLKLGLQKSNLKQEGDEGSSLKPNLKVQQEGNEVGIESIVSFYN